MAAPIILFIYKRPQHLARTLAALQSNAMAAESDLIIFSDGPRQDTEIGAVGECRRLAERVGGFASVRLETHDKNQGLAKSVIAGVSAVLAEHKEAIVLEDDIVTTRHFLPYMNRALALYRADDRVFSVTGYTYPEHRLKIPGDYPFDTYSAYRSSSWGWGCWQDRWSGINWSMDYYDRFMANESGKKEFSRGGDDLVPMLRLQKLGKIDSWAVRFAFAHYAASMNCIHPVKSLVSNIGLDSSGTHTGESPIHVHQSLDVNWEPQRFCPGSFIDSRIAKAFLTAASQPRISLTQRIRRKLMRLPIFRRT